MPRPNVILPKYIIGGVEDYARAHEIDTDDAHAALLLRGLREREQAGFRDIDTELAAFEEPPDDEEDTDNETEKHGEKAN